MKILVTGGAGFIGSNLCDYLLVQDHQLVVIDDLSSGFKENLKVNFDSIEFYQSKLETFDLDKLVSIDAVVHLAAQASAPASISNFYHSTSSNLLSTIKLVDYCKSRGIPMVYASSSAVYGNLPLGDDQEVAVDLLSPYATDKYVSELYLSVVHRLYGLSSIGLRFFNVYGPRQDPKNPYSGVISIFTDRLLASEDVTINGGYQTRDFIYVNDVVDVIYRSIKMVTNGSVCEVVNVLTGNTISIDMLADKMISIIGSRSQKIFKELLLGDPERSEGTTEKMRNLFQLNRHILTAFDEGLFQTIDFMRAQANDDEK